MKDIYKSIEPTLKLCKSEILFAEEIQKMQNLTGATEIKGLFEVSEQLNAVSAKEFTGIL